MIGCLHLNTCLFALRTAINDLGISPALALYGEAISIPGAFVEHKHTLPDELDDEFIHSIQQEMRFLREHILKHDQTLAGPSGQEKQQQFPWNVRYVLVKENPLQASTQSRYFGPFRVLDKTQFPVVTIDRDGVPEKINIMRLKPYYELDEGVDKLASEFDEEIEQFPQFRNSMKLTSKENTSRDYVNPPLMVQLNSEVETFKKQLKNYKMNIHTSLPFNKLRAPSTYDSSSQPVARKFQRRRVLDIPPILPSTTVDMDASEHDDKTIPIQPIKADLINLNESQSTIDLPIPRGMSKLDQP